MRLTNLLNIIVVLLLSCPFAEGQVAPQFTLDQLQKMARDHYPYARQLTFSEQYGEESVKQQDSNWLPQVAFSAKTTAQSEVSAVKIPSNLNLGFSLGTGKKDQYQGEVAITQLVYDGGTNHAMKEISKVKAAIQSENIRTSMLQVETAVNSLFESILINQEQFRVLNFEKADLENRQKDILAGTQNGMVLKSVLQELNAEIIAIEQKKTETKAQLSDLYSQLSFFVSVPIDTSAVLLFPALREVSNYNFSDRPDYKQFKDQTDCTDWQLELIKRKERPQLNLFADGFYGRPGLNTMDYSTHFSGITGINLRWDIGTIYSHDHEKRQLKINREMIRNQQSIFEIEMNKQISQLKIDILKNKQLIDKDDEIVKIRSEVKGIAAVQLSDGSITLTDYLLKLNAESQSMVSCEIHKIELQMDLAKMNTLLNRN